MNFKLFLLIWLVGCGVKGDPRPPAGTELPSWQDTYLFDASRTKEQQPVEEK